ncbi:MAG TPA: DUF1385 domain-containing protein [Blastocatellia bacterium]|jgi:uncharacterized protein YqhQ|nr:DUF1385 domain-containing protein [Blastocatellia bacterium]
MKESEIIVGGQAVIEGVMMRAPHSYAVAVRRPDGRIVARGERLPSFAERYPLLKLPVLRGAVVLVHSMILGIKALNFSASVAFDESEKESGAPGIKEAPKALAVGAGGRVARPVSPVEAVEVEPGAEKGYGKSTTAAAGSLVFALLFNVLLFIVLPLLLTNALFVWLDGGAIHAQATDGAWYAQAWSWIRAALHPVRPSVAFNLIDGLIRMSFFLIMIVTFTFQSDIRRVFEYHGAEHKVVYTWEAGEDLTVENARRKQRQHPRCGTSFLMIVMLVSIIAFSIVKFDSLLFNFLVRVVLIPVVAGVSYEIIRASARSRAQWFFSIITRPGLWLQNLTTREPDDSQLEVAIFALKESLKLEPAPEAAVAA